jgi:hypothetical protein
VHILRRIHHAITRRLILLLFLKRRVYEARFRRAFGERKPVELVHGQRHFPGGRHAIFLIWQPEQTAWYVRNALDALAKAHVNVLLVVNHNLTEERRRELAAQCAKIMIRDNTGFDIGGFQDATAFLYKHTDAERVLYLNDSVYFFREGLAELFERLANSKADVCSAFENWEIHYHFQSFCLSISGDMLRHPKVLKFWNDYLPVNSRRWAIDQGEVGFSRAMLPAAASIEVLYTPPRLKSELLSLPLDDLRMMDRYLPATLRLGPERIKKLSKPELVRELCERVAMRSQVHSGGFLFRRFSGNPLMKKDLVYREQFSLYDVEAMLEELGSEGHADEILSDFRRKGRGILMTGLKRRLFDEGIL